MARWNVAVPTSEYYGPLPLNPMGVIANDVGPLIREISDTVEVAIDTETTGLDKMSDHVLYWSLAWGNRRCTLHASLLPYFKHIFRDERKKWIFANAKFDMHMLANMDVQILGKIWCTQVMHSLLFEETSHGLKDMARHLLGWKWSDFQDTFGKITKDLPPLALIRKAERENFPLLVEYAANDAWGTLGCKQDLEVRLKKAATHSLFRDMPPYIETLWDLFSKIEAPYTKVLWKNERNGILMNREYLAEIEPKARKEIETLEMDIVREVGWLIKVDSPVDKRRYFIDQCKLQPLKMTKGGASGNRQASIDAGFLEYACGQGGQAGKVAKMFLDYGKLSKLYGTYIQGIAEYLDAQGRIHTRFNQDIARCMPAGELVLTNRGYLAVEKVAVGDLVITHTGHTKPVVETSTHEPKPIYRVHLANGLILRTTGNHEYKTPEGWARADELRTSQIVVVHSDAEQWKPIVGWSQFEVSSWGRVRNKRTGYFLTARPKGRWGHLKVCLYRNGSQIRGEDRKDFAVHRLVLKAFSGTGMGETRHLNGIAWDNTVGNLIYGTSSENRQDAIKHGTMSQRRAGRTVLSESDVEAIRVAGTPGQPPSSTSKLSFEKAEEVRAKFPGQGRQELANEYGVSYVSIDNIIKGKTWSRPPSLAKTAEELAELYDVSAGTIRDIWAGRRWKPEDAITGAIAVFQQSTVVFVTVDTSEVTYGLTVADDHSHVTGGVVTHNTGRLSSADPNLQNIPTDENDKWRLRAAFIAPPDEDLIVTDYNQLEMRLLAAASREPDMIGIFLRNWDIHMGNASMMMGIPYDEIKEAKKIDGLVKAGKIHHGYLTARVLQCLSARARAKNIGFGLNYGMGAGKLAVDLGITRAEAEALIALYKKTYPAVTKFYDEAVAITRQTGYAFTILGRRRNLPDIASPRNDQRARAERQAINVEIQGSAADVVKMAQILLDKANLEYKYGCKALLNIHDELIHQCPKETSKIALAEIIDWMEHPFHIDLDVPLTVAGGIAPDWASAK